MPSLALDTRFPTGMTRFLDSLPKIFYLKSVMHTYLLGMNF